MMDVLNSIMPNVALIFPGCNYLISHKISMKFFVHLGLLLQLPRILHIYLSVIVINSAANKQVI